MKKAFEKRIDTLSWDNERVKKEKARGLIDMKLKMDKEVETKSLLLKKLSCYIKWEDRNMHSFHLFNSI